MNRLKNILSSRIPRREKIVGQRDDFTRSIETITGTSVRNRALYERALTHRSLLRNHPNQHLESNERLEFLGDAVLGCIIAEYLYKNFGAKEEGFMTRIRSKLVNGAALAEYARQIGLSRLIRLSENMERSGGRDSETILADAFEALLGAMWLDSGIDATRRFVLAVVDEHVDLDQVVTSRENYKSILLEFAQAQGWRQPHYRVVEERGPSHDREFSVEVYVDGESVGAGVERSKKKAEQKAAAAALERIGGPGTVIN